MRLPLGFKNEETFVKALRRFREAAGSEDAVVGIRGSASTGVSADAGTPFGPDSDLDFFLVSDDLFRRGIALGASTNNGALRVGATQRYFPELSAVEKILSAELGRKTTLRVFSGVGYDLVKVDTDILEG